MCNMDTDDLFKDIVEDVETRFDTSKYELDTPLKKGRNKKVMGFLRDKLGGKIMNELLQHLNFCSHQNRDVQQTVIEPEDWNNHSYDENQ